MKQGPLFTIAKRMETLAIRQFDTVGVMSPANIPYFWKETPSFRGKVEVLPLWGPQTLAQEGNRQEIRHRFGLPQDRIYETAGKAASEPLLPENPAASANRRLSILLLKEAPPAPSGGPLGN